VRSSDGRRSAPGCRSRCSDRQLHQCVTTLIGYRPGRGRWSSTTAPRRTQTASLLWDHLDFVHAVEGFLEGFPGASLTAMHRGFRSLGVQDISVLTFYLMDSASLFPTANCDTSYFITFVDLSSGPMVLEVPALGPPSGILGAVDDMWFRWVTDLGVSGPDRAQGGKYLLVGPGHDGHTGKWFPRRAFPDVTGRRVRPHVHGRQRPRTRSQDHQGRVADLPLLPRNRGHPGRGVPGRQGTARAARAATRNDIPRGLGIVVQHGPTERLHLLGHHPRTGATRTSRRRRPAHPGTAGLRRRITKGKPFAPDDRLRGILEDAAPSATPPPERCPSPPARKRASPTTKTRTG